MLVKIPASNFASGGVLNGFAATGEGDPGAACGVGCDNSISASVTGGADNNTVDFGYNTASYPVSGRVWNDNGAGGGVAGNGVQDGTEPGIQNVTVTLYKDTNNNGIADPGEPVFATTTTNANGDYTFNGVPNGNYAVVVDKAMLPSTAYGQTGDPDQPGVPCTTCDSQGNVDVNNAAVTGKNFGYKQTLGSISGTLCEGTGDGLCDDPGDTPLGAGVPVS